MLPLSTPADEDAPFTLSRLVEKLAPSDGRFESQYRQTVASSLLSDPTEITGEIRYELPGRLYKTEHGGEIGERIIEIRNSTVHVTDERGERSFLLDNAPALHGLMASLHALASGDGEILANRFEASVSGEWYHWSLLLKATLPENATNSGKHDIGASERSIDITLEGHDDVIERIRIVPPQSARITLELLQEDTGS